MSALMSTHLLLMVVRWQIASRAYAALGESPRVSAHGRGSGRPGGQKRGREERGEPHLACLANDFHGRVHGLGGEILVPGAGDRNRARARHLLAGNAGELEADLTLDHVDVGHLAVFAPPPPTHTHAHTRVRLPPARS